jgi:regulator of nucleoside diphosphate kinase
MLIDATCAHCGAAIPDARPACAHCGGDRGLSMPERYDPETCVLTARDFALLTDYVNRHGDERPFVSDMVRNKLSHARVVLADDLDTDVVTIDSRVIFSINGGPFDTRTLVHWANEPDVGLTLPVTIPLGIAMLGRRSGETVRYRQRDGSLWSVAIEDVPYQPAAARKRRKGRSEERVAGVARARSSDAARTFAATPIVALAAHAGRRATVRSDDDGPSAA